MRKFAICVALIVLLVPTSASASHGTARERLSTSIDYTNHYNGRTGTARFETFFGHTGLNPADGCGPLQVGVARVMDYWFVEPVPANVSGKSFVSQNPTSRRVANPADNAPLSFLRQSTVPITGGQRATNILSSAPRHGGRGPGTYEGGTVYVATLGNVGAKFNISAGIHLPGPGVRVEVTSDRRKATVTHTNLTTITEAC